MLVQILMLVALLVFVGPGGFLMSGAVVGFSCIFGSHSAKRNQLSEILLMAGRAFSSGGRREEQVLKTVAALPAEVFIDWHNRANWRLLRF
jgi:hypothetical protein